MNKLNRPRMLLHGFLWFLVFFIAITSLFTAHLDVKRFGCAFSLTSFQSLIPFAFKLSPWQAANTSPSCDYPYGFLLYITVSSFFNIFRAGFLPTFLQILTLKLPIVGAYCLYILFLTKRKIPFWPKLFGILAPQLALQQVMGGQYDLIPYLLLLVSVLTLMQHRNPNTYLYCLILALSIALKPTTVLLLLPVAPLYLVSRPNNTKRTLLPALVFMSSLMLACIVEIYFFLLDPSYSTTVGVGGVILFQNSRLFALNLFVPLYVLLVICMVIISLRLSSRPNLGVDKLQLLACLTLSSVGCLFTLHSVSSLGWSSISAIVLPFILSYTQPSLIFPNLAFQIAFIAHLAVIPNSPFMDMFSPLKSIFPAFVVKHIPDLPIGFVYSTLDKPTSDQIVYLTTILLFCASCFLFYSNAKIIFRLSWP